MRVYCSRMSNALKNQQVAPKRSSLAAAAQSALDVADSIKGSTPQSEAQMLEALRTSIALVQARRNIAEAVRLLSDFPVSAERAKANERIALVCLADALALMLGVA